MSILVVAEHDNHNLKPATLNAVSAALKIGEVTVIVAGHQCEAVGEEAAKIVGVSKVIVSSDAAFANGLAVSHVPTCVASV